MLPICAKWTLLLEVFGQVHCLYKGCLVSLLSSCFVEISELNANSVDTDQRPHSMASDLGLHCLTVSLLSDTGALWCSGKASDSRSRGTGFDPH